MRPAGPFATIVADNALDAETDPRQSRRVGGLGKLVPIIGRQAC